ncbi:MAG: 3'-5' exonuclease, partial [Rhizobacter sp.]
MLSRKRESLRLAAQALRRVDVPYAAPEDTLLMDAPEARDMVALLDALVSTTHRLSLAQALRSPLFGASDADLIALAERAVAGDWWRALLAPDAALSPAMQRARHWLPCWREAATRLPPHDLLARIVFEGEWLERVAATVPAVQRQAALDAIDAVLAQALMLDGARYATPYNFVRALKRRAIKVASPRHADAVQLLTVHGAKGLEAAAVFVMDADPQPKNPDTATLLVDWPVEAEQPRRCAFVYSEAACPPSLVPVLDAERAARQREELNGLYVAMTRAKQRLVFSATEPSRRGTGLS